jgi:SAM-dependent methyltransferase
MLTNLQYQILKRISPGEPTCCSGAAYLGKSKLRILLGDELMTRIQGKTVVDFGCGSGAEAIEMATLANRVIGVDIREDALEEARRNACQAGVADKCEFRNSAPETRADIIVSIDSFEHFADSAAILRTMGSLLKPGGEVLASFGPTWYHPLGGHLFSVFPWAHLLFSEQALLRWRSDFKTDGASRFGEVAGGLNQMTIQRFENIVRESPFDIGEIELVPIRKLQILHNKWTREYTTAIVRCRLVKP